MNEYILNVDLIVKIKRVVFMNLYVLFLSLYVQIKKPKKYLPQFNLMNLDYIFLVGYIENGWLVLIYLVC